MEKVGFGGGCHWCTEAVFSSLKGVSKVEQGWISSTFKEAETFSEAIIVHFDKNIIPLEVLVEIHLLTHSSTSSHSMRGKYRSAIYAFNDTQTKTLKVIMIEKQKLFNKPIITQIYTFKAFKLNDEKFLNYYEKNKTKPFCENFIEPKLKMIFEKYGDFTKN